MITTLIPLKNFSVKYTYELPLTSTVNLLKKLKILSYISNTGNHSTQRLPVMFLRSPKHFKTGKQIIFYSNRRITFTKYFSSSNSMLFKRINEKYIFNFFKNYAPRFYTNEIFVGRVSVQTSVTLKFNGWGYIYTNSWKCDYFLFYLLNFNVCC